MEAMGTGDLPRIEAAIGRRAEGPRKWLLQLARLNILLPDGVPIETIAADWGVSQMQAEERLDKINSLGPFVEEKEA